MGDGNALGGWLSTTQDIGWEGPVELHLDRPHSARFYDYMLGGKTNFPPDREFAEWAQGVFPSIRETARANRRFVTDTVRRLAERDGVRQFLDLGTGIPTSPNTHEVAQRAQPDAHVVYADNDPIVLTHARALMGSTPQGRVDYIQADLREPDRILEHPCLAGDAPALDLSEPVALVLAAVLHFLPDEDDPHGAVRTLLGALPPGSRLVLTHVVGDGVPERMRDGAAEMRQRGITAAARSRTEVERFAAGLDIQWSGPLPGAAGADAAGLPVWSLIARKP